MVGPGRVGILICNRHWSNLKILGRSLTLVLDPGRIGILISIRYRSNLETV